MTKPRFMLDDATLSRVRIVSGLILFAYVIVHLLNHSLGLISNEIMGKTMDYVNDVVRFLPVSIALYGALLAHTVCALIRIYSRRSLKMPLSEWAQAASGLTIPFLLLVHVMGTRYASYQYEINDTYTYVLLSTFVFSQWSGWMNAIGLVVAWVHGCMGFYMWARLKRWFTRKHWNALLVAATLLPVLALGGYLSAGRRIVPLATDGEFMERYYSDLNLMSDDVWTWIARDTEYVRWTLITILVLTLVGRFVRVYLEKRRNDITIDYTDGPAVKARVGSTLLEISQLTGVPHASVCGGRGRCSTCRVRLIEQVNETAPPSESEQRVLQRVRAGDDVRLACQLRPTGDLKVIRLLPPDTTVAKAADVAPWATGTEQVVSVMFADLRDFTRTAESRLPFDVVYLINQFSRHMGQAVQAEGGQIDKFLGDGFMALFGLDGTPEEAAQASLRAALAMVSELDVLNEKLRNDLDKPLRMGIGIHTGAVILGDMGYGRARGLTAIGDVVNIASRLETETKTQKCLVCISKHSVDLASVTISDANSRSVAVRGKKHKLDIYALNDDVVSELIEQTKAPGEKQTA